MLRNAERERDHADFYSLTISPHSCANKIKLQSHNKVELNRETKISGYCGVVKHEMRSIFKRFLFGTHAALVM